MRHRIDQLPHGKTLAPGVAVATGAALVLGGSGVATAGEKPSTQPASVEAQMQEAVQPPAKQIGKALRNHMQEQPKNGAPHERVSIRPDTSVQNGEVLTLKTSSSGDNGKESGYLSVSMKGLDPNTTYDVIAQRQQDKASGSTTSEGVALEAHSPYGDGWFASDMKYRVSENPPGKSVDILNTHVANPADSQEVIYKLDAAHHIAGLSLENAHAILDQADSQ